VVLDEVVAVAVHVELLAGEVDDVVGDEAVAARLAALGLAGGRVKFAGELVIAKIWYFLESMLFLKKR
jgi:hypothetical protein